MDIQERGTRLLKGDGEQDLKEYIKTQGSLAAQLVKNLPAMQEIPVRFLGRKDPLEKGQATYSSILAGESPWTEEPGRLQPMESQRGGYY